MKNDFIKLVVVDQASKFDSIEKYPEDAFYAELSIPSKLGGSDIIILPKKTKLAFDLTVNDGSVDGSDIIILPKPKKVKITIDSSEYEEGEMIIPKSIKFIFD